MNDIKGQIQITLNNVMSPNIFRILIPYDYEFGNDIATITLKRNFKSFIEHIRNAWVILKS